MLNEISHLSLRRFNIILSSDILVSGCQFSRHGMTIGGFYFISARHVQSQQVQTIEKVIKLCHYSIGRRSQKLKHDQTYHGAFTHRNHFNHCSGAEPCTARVRLLLYRYTFVSSGLQTGRNINWSCNPRIQSSPPLFQRLLKTSRSSWWEECTSLLNHCTKGEAEGP